LLRSLDRITSELRASGRDQQTVPPVTITCPTLLFGQPNELACLVAGKNGQAPL
jgi:hypothetical protein